MLNSHIELLSSACGDIHDDTQIGAWVFEPLWNKVKDIDISPTTFVHAKSNPARFRLGQCVTTMLVKNSGKNGDPVGVEILFVCNKAGEGHGGLGVERLPLKKHDSAPVDRIPLGETIPAINMF